MPYIDAKLTISLSSEQKEDLKSEFGKLISCPFHEGDISI